MITSAVVISPIFYVIIYILKKKFGWFKDEEPPKLPESKNGFDPVCATDRSISDINRSYNDLKVD